MPTCNIKNRSFGEDPSRTMYFMTIYKNLQVKKQRLCKLHVLLQSDETLDFSSIIIIEVKSEITLRT